MSMSVAESIVPVTGTSSGSSTADEMVLSASPGVWATVGDHAPALVVTAQTCTS